MEIAGYLMKDKLGLAGRIEATVQMFPDLREHVREGAGNASGGEKKQLVLARALMLKPKLLLMDEPSLGLSPKLVTAATETIRSINHEFKTTIVVVEQKVRELLSIANRVYALRMGEGVFSGSPSMLIDGDALKKIFLI